LLQQVARLQPLVDTQSTRSTAAAHLKLSAAAAGWNSLSLQAAVAVVVVVEVAVLAATGLLLLANLQAAVHLQRLL
jgi:hypothetical protein